MSGVFLSYSRADRAVAGQIVRGLRALGVEVWWDEDMRGVDWQDELARQIAVLDAVVVLWTHNSVGSMHVKDEARLARDNNKLINVMAGVAKPPFPFDSINGLPLDGWTGRAPHPGWARTVETVEELAVRAGGAGKGGFTAALARRDAEIRAKEAAVAQAQAAFEDAQNRAAEAAEAAAAESATFAHAQEVYRRVVELTAGSGVLRSAQDDLEKARAAKDEADQAERAAKSQLSAASRELSRATAELNKLFSETFDPLAPAPDQDAPPPLAAEPVIAPPPPVAPPTPKVEPPAVTKPAPAPKPDLAADRAPPTAVAKGRIPVLAWVAGGVVVLVALLFFLQGSQPPEPVLSSNAQPANSANAAESATSAPANSGAPSAGPPSAAATAVAAGDSANQAGNSKAAFAAYMQAALLGDAHAQDQVCNFYYNAAGPCR